MSAMPRAVVVPNTVLVKVLPAGPSKYCNGLPRVADKSHWSKSHCPATLLSPTSETEMVNDQSFVKDLGVGLALSL